MASKPEQEPSIEEILASIRQIISDDDQPRETDIDLSQPEEEKFVIPVAEPADEEKPPAASFAEVLDLTNEISEEPVNIPTSIMDISMEEASFTIPPEPEPVKVAPQSAPISQFPPNVEKTHHAPAATADSIFTSMAAEATTAAFSKLVGNIPVEREGNMSMYENGRVTLEDITRELLKPMLRDWIDMNVPALVERLVEKELEKLARQAQGD